MSNNNELVEMVYREHYEWLLRVCTNFENSTEAAEDLLHTVMLKLLEMPDIDRLRYNGSVNLYYIYKMARSISLTNKKRNINAVELADVEAVDDIYDFDMDANTEAKLAAVNNVLSTAHWYDNKLFTTYFEEDHSLTSLAEATSISRSSVYNTISKVKRTIRSEYMSSSVK